MWQVFGTLARAVPLAVLLMIGACGGSAPAPPPTSTPLTPEAVLSQSGQVMQALRTFHFKLEHEVGSTALIPGLAVHEAEGDVVKPDRLAADFDATFAALNIVVKASMKAIGDVNYMTNPLDGKWATMDTQISPVAFFDPSRGISNIMAQLAQVRHIVLEVAENIARGNFPATENQYCPCDFPEHCPYYRQQYMATVPELARQEPLPGLVVADAVERYVSLQQEIKELQVKFDEVKQAIVAFCQKGALNRVHGSEHAITCKLIERAGFNEDEVRALLEPEGLWDNVLSFDQSRLKQFLADEAVAKDIKNRLEALRRVVSTRPQLWVKKLIEEE